MEYTLKNSFLNMISGKGSKEDFADSVRIWRSDYVFIAASLALLGGFFLPFSLKILDILWGFSLCLTAAILLVSIFAKDTSELTGFPVLIAAVTLFRMVLNIAAVKKIFLHDSGGLLIDLIGRPIAEGNTVFVLTIIPIAAVVIMIVIFRSTQKITDIALGYLTEVMPIKKIGVETDLSIGTINNKQAQIIRDRIQKESQFYINTASVSKLLQCDAVIMLAVTVISIFGQSIMASLDKLTTKGLLHDFAPLAAGCAIITLLPAVVIALVCVYLSSKDTLKTGEITEDSKKQTKKVKIISSETGQTEEVELLNPDFVKVSEPQITDSQNNTENIVTFEPVKTVAAPEEKPSLPASKWFNNIDEYYDYITDKIDESPTWQSMVLFVAEKTEELPVTMAVNVGIRFHDKKQSCLIIDADSKRAAVEKVFELDESQNTDPVETFIDGLHVSTSDKSYTVFERLDEFNCKFDRVIIYCPDIDILSDQQLDLLKKCHSVVFSASEKAKERIFDKLDLSPDKTLAVLRSP